jgi:hypothetical protein
MAYVLARVELHDAAGPDYERLHVTMLAAKFSRSYQKGQQAYWLPIGEYCSFDYEDASIALTAAKVAARKVSTDFEITLLLGDAENIRDYNLREKNS